jgi:signal transduction histidine kinase/CheY-like chemotaxis protein
LCASFVLPWNVHINSAYLLQTVMVSAVCLGLALYASLRGFAYARSLLLMAVIHVTLHGAYLLSLAEWIPDSVISPWLVHLSCLAEALLLSMILASQFILVRSRASDAEAKHRVAAAEAELEKKTHLEKSRFLAQASHDLRQPLHSLSLLATTLQIKTWQPDQKQLIDDMQKSIRSMNAMFADMLDLSRIDTGIIAPKPQAFFIQEILQELNRECLPAATQKNITLRVQTHTNWQVLSDPFLLKRILRNLLVNAIHNTPSGSVMVGCRYRGNQLRIDVLDSGPGIDAVQLQAIFDEFVRGDSAQHQEGLGLGLAIVKRLANSMHHPVEVASCPGQGSRFSVSVPLVKQAAVEGRENRVPPPLAESSVLQGRVMAIMDDDESVRHSLTVLLQALGGIVIAGADATEIIHALQQTEELPELLIVDYSLARGKRGPDEAIKIGEYLGDPGIPLLVITGDTSSHTLLALHKKPWRVLNKPVDPELLLQWIFQKLL